MAIKAFSRPCRNTLMRPAGDGTVREVSFRQVRVAMPFIDARRPAIGGSRDRVNVGPVQVAAPTVRSIAMIA